MHERLQTAADDPCQPYLLAKWDGQSWSALGSGLTGGSIGGVASLVFAGGFCRWWLLRVSGGEPSNNIAEWRVPVQQFADVAPDNAFYPYIDCLVGQDILSGTRVANREDHVNSQNLPSSAPGGECDPRGQLAKIVSNAGRLATMFLAH